VKSLLEVLGSFLWTKIASTRTKDRP
jgi:hypothetical protein